MYLMFDYIIIHYWIVDMSADNIAALTIGVRSLCVCLKGGEMVDARPEDEL